MKNKLLILILFFFVSCKNKNVTNYIQWYKDQSSHETKVAGVTIKIKELTPEMLLITSSKGHVSASDIQKLYKSDRAEEYLRFIVDINSDKEARKIGGNNLSGKLECLIDGEQVTDVVSENPGVGSSQLRYLIIIKKDLVKENSALTLIHPLLGEESVHYKLKDVNIPNKKNLSI